MPNRDEQTEAAPASGDVWLGAVLIGLAATTIGLAQSIRALGLGDNFDPGAKAFPIGLAIILGIGGIIEGWQGWRHPQPTGGKPGATKTTAILVAGLAVYVGLLPWLGFALTTLILATPMMRWLGSPWKWAVIASLVLIGIVYALFVLGFKVPLPGGVLNLPF